MLGNPVLLDIECLSLTEGILNFFPRKLKNCIEIALIIKFEFSHNQCRGTMGRGIPSFHSLFYFLMSFTIPSSKTDASEIPLFKVEIFTEPQSLCEFVLELE